jgi:hypothetical protein
MYQKINGTIIYISIYDKALKVTFQTGEASGLAKHINKSWQLLMILKNRRNEKK